MEKYVFLFKRQQFQYLTKSVALAAGAFLTTAAATTVLYLLTGEKLRTPFSALTFILFLIPGTMVYYRHLICRRMSFRTFLLLIALTTSLPMVRIVAKTGLPLTLYALAAATVLFLYTLHRGMRVRQTLNIISLFYLMFFCVAACSLLEAFVALFNGGGPSLYVTFAVAAVIFGKINIRDVFQFRLQLPEGTAMEEKEINKVVEETALNLYLNFIGMIFVVDFMKFVVRVLAENPKKNASE